MKNYKLVGHRGAKNEKPENTMKGFEYALQYVDVIELDIHQTRDKKLVVIHDQSFDRTTNGKGLIKNAIS